MKWIERRVSPADSPLALATAMVVAIFAAMLVTASLFLLYGANPFTAYLALFKEPFATWRGFGYTLVHTAPLTLIALGTIVSWRSGFGYLGFEGCFVVGAAATSWLALATVPGGSCGSAARTGFSAVRDFAEFCHRGGLGRNGGADTRALWRQRGIDLVDDELRRHPDRAVPGIGPDAGSGWRAGDRAVAALDVVAIYCDGHARPCGHSAGRAGNLAGVGAAAQDALWV